MDAGAEGYRREDVVGVYDHVRKFADELTDRWYIEVVMGYL